MKQIVIFGGSFNPPTRAHQAIIAACLGLPQFDEVWAIASGKNAGRHIAPAVAQYIAAHKLYQ